MKPLMISMSQQHFATVLKTVVTTVSNRPYIFSHVILNFTAGVATVTKPSQTIFFLKKNINLKYFLFILMAY
jgi:hypothetical protein